MKTLFLKITAMLTLTIVLQTAAYFIQARISRDYPAKMETMYRILSGDPDVLYLGDSTLTSISAHDSIQRTIPELLAGYLPQRRVDTINNGAYHAGVYYHIANRLVKKGKFNTILIIPINPRSFPAAWDMRPEYQFSREILLLDYDNILLRVFYGPLSIFKVFNSFPVSAETFNRLPVYEGTRVIGRMIEFSGEAGKGQLRTRRCATG